MNIMHLCVSFTDVNCQLICWPAAAMSQWRSTLELAPLHLTFRYPCSTVQKKTHTALFYISLKMLWWSWHSCGHFDVHTCALRCVPACDTCLTLCLKSNSIGNLTCNALRDGQRCHVTLLPVTKALCRAESNHQG